MGSSAGSFYMTVVLLLRKDFYPPGTRQGTEWVENWGGSSESNRHQERKVKGTLYLR